ncbi:MAG: hypothetical protein HY348_03620 [Nitrospira defluvii]|nr:hypothetical protein [Nitrospira defluvii]
MVRRDSLRPRPIARITLFVLVLVLGCQATLSVRTVSAARSGTEAIQGLGSYFLTLPYGGIKMAVAVLGAVVGGLGFVFTGGDSEQNLGPIAGGEYVITPEHIRGEKDLHFFGNAHAS